MTNLIQAEQAVREGASFITHLFNAMPPVLSIFLNYIIRLLRNK